MSEKNKDWAVVASERVDAEKSITKFALDCRASRWRVLVRQTSPDEVCRYGDTEGRGSTPEAACEEVRLDIFAWCSDRRPGGGNALRAEYATALRKLCYAAEDAE